ncbi:YdcF family protein [Actinoplanes sp. LDG1-06]|uniref:YdcF family protein n=1 Tax=Paractinoplanes ovalisporus TaxID=2810368 RepID=A0ABS2A4V5_9ACTN|nr:ElyC/SanA/YdcF family protein [Actinoplanes ovalisporus]MBM2614879.1 YdcF family protein [Actinoplanes ovalisporus]
MIERHVNTLADFCALRDVPELTRDAVEEVAGGRVDVAILFGGSTLAGGDVFAQAIADEVADRYMIVGGQGHSTDVLRAAVGWPDAEGMTEAAIFDRYLGERHGVRTDLLEQESTNCGNNVTLALARLAEHHVPVRRILIIQDATMQRRMDAGFRLHAPRSRIVNFASHRTHVPVARPPLGMWAPERYLEMLMGEIPRFTGYGPEGRGFIAHVDVPAAVTEAWAALRDLGVGEARVADQRWAG